MNQRDRIGGIQNGPKLEDQDIVVIGRELSDVAFKGGIDPAVQMQEDQVLWQIEGLDEASEGVEIVVCDNENGEAGLVGRRVGQGRECEGYGKGGSIAVPVAEIEGGGVEFEELEEELFANVRPDGGGNIGMCRMQSRKCAVENGSGPVCEVVAIERRQGAVGELDDVAAVESVRSREVERPGECCCCRLCSRGCSQLIGSGSSSVGRRKQPQAHRKECRNDSREQQKATETPQRPSPRPWSADLDHID